MKRDRLFGIADIFVSCVVDSRRERFVSLIELDHLRMLFQFDLLLELQLCRGARVGRQTGKLGHLTDHLVRWLPEVAGLGF